MLHKLLEPYAKTLSPLIGLREAFNQSGFELRLVGGCVRDLLCGMIPKDFDVCTNANPEEQRAIYEAKQIRHVDTGLQHGTWTVIMHNNTFEITSLRADVDTDGRHAVVSYTKDWIVDLARRDLTINAMAMTFAGNIIDPFDGQVDLKNGVVRFVGDPSARISEDYLRVLRWVRFHARFAQGRPFDAQTIEAVCKPEVAVGLRGISRERIWSEVSKILTGPDGVVMFMAFRQFGLFDAMSLPTHTFLGRDGANNSFANGLAPHVIMGSLLRRPDLIDELANSWKWSNSERRHAIAVIKATENGSLTLEKAKVLVAGDGENLEWMADALAVTGRTFDSRRLRAWKPPSFPITGDDLLQAGMKPNAQFGSVLLSLRKQWAESGFDARKEDLLAKIATQ